MELLQDFRAVHGRRWQVLLANRGFHALIIYRLSHFLWKRHVPILPMIFSRLIQFIDGIDIDYQAEIAGGCWIIHGYGVVIGRGTIIGPNAIIFHGVTLGRSFTERKEDGYPTIGQHVFIGAGAKVLGKVKIGDFVTIGANTVVTGDVPSHHLVYGNPCIKKQKDH